jgi:hypothetical protein
MTARRGELTCFDSFCQPIFTETEAGLMTEGLAFSMSLQTKMRLKQILLHDKFLCLYKPYGALL